MVVFKMLLLATLVSQANDGRHITCSGLFGGGPVPKGEEVKVLSLYPGDKTLCCFGPECYRRYLKALQAHDDADIAAIIEEGQAVALDEGTEVKVLDDHNQRYETYRGVDPVTGRGEAIISAKVGETIPVMAYEVRILNGPNKGKSGWLPQDARSRDFLVSYRDGSRVVIGVPERGPDRKTARFDPESKVQVARDVEAYNEYWLKYKIYGHVFESGNLTRSRRVIDVSSGTQADVIGLHERRSGVLTEPAVEVKFLVGSLKGKLGYVHPAQITAPTKSKRR